MVLIKESIAHKPLPPTFNLILYTPGVVKFTPSELVPAGTQKFGLLEPLSFPIVPEVTVNPVLGDIDQTTVGDPQFPSESPELILFPPILVFVNVISVF